MTELAWTAINEHGKANRYAIRSGKYSIAKVTVKGQERFELWYGQEFRASFATPEEAKKHAARLVFGEDEP